MVYIIILLFEYALIIFSNILSFLFISSEIVNEESKRKSPPKRHYDSLENLDSSKDTLPAVSHSSPKILNNEVITSENSSSLPPEMKTDGINNFLLSSHPI